MENVRSLIHEGMLVRSTDGETLGKVKSVGAEGFIIEKGLLFKDDFAASLANVREVSGDEITYEKRAVAAPIGEAGASSVEVRVPLAEEEVVVEKEARQQGEVRIRKEVITETKQVTVPVQKERVFVERVPAAPGTPVTTEPFKETEISVPVMEEEIRVTKTPVVKEEVRVRKEPVVEQRTTSTQVRHEEAHVDESDEDTGRKRGRARAEEEGLRASGRDEQRKK